MNQPLHLPGGFRYSGTTCGIKESGNKDICLIAAEENERLVAAGVYTQNIVRAASIDWNRSITPSKNLAGLIVNSGNANACTGEVGKSDNKEMAKRVASRASADENEVVVLSTGIIGKPLPMEKIRPAIDIAWDTLGSEEANFMAAAEAIMTTDSRVKVASTEVEILGETVRIAGFCKGAGMIGPNMATMLAVLVTDASLTTDLAQQAVETSVNQSFNRISVEGHTSTNDGVVLLSSGVRKIDFKHSEDFFHFAAALTEVSVRLAKMIPDDGEGASHLITIDIDGAHDDRAAEQIARTIASSNLVKTAIAGADPNWGRIVSAAGYAGVEFDSKELKLELNGFPVFNDGAPVAYDESAVSQSIRDQRETLIKLRVGHGRGAAKHWTSDLTVDYVKFNSEYTT